mmetsp:Transcript_52077/g.97412  ORF Transcript_52077/g.97412 Transcript_52077/m.97412 type:complete len:452 (-) Transcript_52077:206-1561(-)
MAYRALAVLAALPLAHAGGAAWAPAQASGYEVDYKTYEDYKKEVEAAGEGAMNYTTFTKEYEKYQQFKKYLAKDGGRSPVDFKKFLADYKQFMDFKSYLSKGVHHQEDSSKNFQDFLDFEKYLQYTKSRGAGAGGDYQQYVPGVQLAALDETSPSSDKGADSTGSSFGGSPFGGSGFGGSGFANTFVPADTTEGGPKGGLTGVTHDFRQYMDYSKYMGISHQYTNKDWMSEWKQFQQEGSSGQQAPYSPKDCKTEAELDAWRDKQKEIAKKWIPTMYQEPTLSNIDQEYKENLERIKNPPAAQAPAVPAVSEPIVMAKEKDAQPAKASAAAQPSTAGARTAQSPAELVAWRGQMGMLVDQLPSPEQSQWNAVLDGEMEAAFKRLGADADVQLVDKEAPKAVKSSNGFSRTLLAFVVSFSMPVAGMYVYRAIKEAPGTDLDARFLAVDDGHA